MRQDNRIRLDGPSTVYNNYLEIENGEMIKWLFWNAGSFPTRSA